MKILFASSEVYPLEKTGGLADVSAGLPKALLQLGYDVRIVMPAYPHALSKGGRLQTLSDIHAGFAGRLLQGKLPKSKLPVWFVDIPEYFQRIGGPYVCASGQDWPDNAQRFCAFSRIIEQLATDQLELDWQPDIVHCNDWQTGLVPALLSRHRKRPATLFTIHNLAYQGLFHRDTFDSLDLPQSLWDMHGVEFHGQLSFMKGGLVFADMVNTVSPSYAEEIRSSAFGYGLEGLLNHRRDKLHGILNGVDYRQWNPSRDPYLPHHFSKTRLQGKQLNKQALQQALGLPENPDTPVIGMVGRMVDQKGYDLVLQALPRLLQQAVQIIMLGSGDKRLENDLQKIATRYPHKLGVRIGYDEGLAHLIEAGADMFLMPSRFEPCGLNQIYSLRYGTIPIVHHVGGLIDSVVDTTKTSLQNDTATGFHFHAPTSEHLLQAVQRALKLFRQHPQTWRKLILNGMSADYSWARSAREYLTLYQKAIKSQGAKAGQDRV